MNDPEDQDHAILLQYVVHHTVVTHPKAVEGIADSLDRLDRFAADPSRCSGIGPELPKRSPDPGPFLDRQLLEGTDRRRRELDGERGQSRSRSRVVRPLA
jgi:hypothetical protein